MRRAVMCRDDLYLYDSTSVIPGSGAKKKNSAMPAHRKHLDVHVMSGATRKNPQRFGDRKQAPQPIADLGKPPKHLTDDEKKAWKEIAKQVPPGVLGNTDRIAVEIAARLLVRFRTGLLLKASEVSCLVSLLARFGMTPADRNKIETGANNEPDDLTDEWSPVTKLRRNRKQLRDAGDDREDSDFEVGPRLVRPAPLGPEEG